MTAGHDYHWSGPLGEYLLTAEEAGEYLHGIVHDPQADYHRASTWVALEIAEQREVKVRGTPTFVI